MLLTITGGTTAMAIPTETRLVSVEDEVDFLGYTRARLLKDILLHNQAALDGLDDSILLDADTQAELLKSLRVNLTDTGLTEFPETNEEMVEVYRKLLHNTEVYIEIDKMLCPQCGGEIESTAHGLYCPRAECKWGWEVERDGSPLKPPIKLRGAL